MKDSVDGGERFRKGGVEIALKMKRRTRVKEEE